MTANMYRVGDYVYFETSSTSPFQIRRIEELNKTPSGNVEAKVMCFFRRRDLPPTLVSLADKHHWSVEAEGEGCGEDLSPLQRHLLRHRELFLSRQVETLPATHIRGKCSVTLLNETESFFSYIGSEDTFFYCLVFDPSQRTLLADKGEIRVGSRYQADIAPILSEGESDNRSLADLETLVWTPDHTLTDRQIDQFLVTARSVGTFARALDCTSSVKQPSLHMSAAAASRDITLFHAMDILHRHSYEVAGAVSALIPPTGPVLCRDEMEEWSASEANLFEEALEKYGKDFNDIRHDFLPWKSLKNIIEYYYMWKTTDRYVQQKRVKAVEAESKLKQVYIPNYPKVGSGTPPVGTGGTGSAVIGKVGAMNGGSVATDGGRPCESCTTQQSVQWYPYGPAQMQSRLCSPCWSYWKKYGGLKRVGAGGTFVGGAGVIDPAGVVTLSDLSDIKRSSSGKGSGSDDERPSSHRPPHRCSIIGCQKEFKVKGQLARHYAAAHGLAVRAGSPKPIMKTRTAFYLATNALTKVSRRLCRQSLRPRRAARSPFWPINAVAVKAECVTVLASRSMTDMRVLLSTKPPARKRGSVTHIATRLALHRNYELKVPEWLAATDRDKLPRSERIAFPRPPKAPDGSLLYERVPNRGEVAIPKIPSSTMGIGTASAIPLVASPSAGTLLGQPQNQQQMLSHTSVPNKRKYDDMVMMSDVDINGLYPNQMPQPVKKVTKMVGGMRMVINQLNGKMRGGALAAAARGGGLHSGGGRKSVVAWMDAPDDVFFKSNESTRRIRRALASNEMRRAARKPWRKLSVKLPQDAISHSAGSHHVGMQSLHGLNLHHASGLPGGGQHMIPSSQQQQQEIMTVLLD